MLKKILEIWHNWSEHGLKVPFIRDWDTEKPSVTLLSYYVMLALTVVSLITLHFRLEQVVATTYTILAWILSFIFYRVRKLNKAKVDLDDASVELDSGEQEKEEEKE